MNNTTHEHRYNALVQQVDRWEKRWRIKKLVLWLPRLMLVPLAFGIGLAIFSRFYYVLAPQDILFVTVGILVGFLMGFVGWFWFARRSPIEAARYFDVEFGLQERTSTALDLMDGRIHTTETLAQAQVVDAQAYATAFAYKHHLALVIRRLDWAIVAGVCILFAILLLLPNPTSDTLALAQAERERIEQSAETVKDVIEAIANDPSLDAVTREELLRTLQASLETLENPNISQDEALATLNEVQQAMQDRAQQLAERSQAQQQALQQALEALREAQTVESQSFSEALSQLQEELAQTEEETQQSEETGEGGEQSTSNELANALRDAADQLRQTTPSLAQSLERAAQALEQGDNQTAQEALEQAQQQLAQQPQNQNQQQAQQNLSQAAEQLQQAQQQLAQQPQNQELAQQQNQQQQNQQSEQQQGQQNQQQGQQQQNNSQDQQNNDANSEQQGDAQGDNQGNNNPQQGGGQPQGQGEDGDAQQNQSAQGGEMSNTAPVDNIGGDTTGDLTQDGSGVTMVESNQPQSQRDNAGGQSQYETVFAPQRLGGSGGEEIILAPDVDNAPIREGDFAENDAGAITVPYNEVFNTYFGNANSALDQGYIPLGLRDVIRQYFTSLSPRSTNNGR